MSRNAPCPCGSGKRFKSCHGAINNENQQRNKPLEKVVTERLYCAYPHVAYEQPDERVTVVNKTTGRTICLPVPAYKVFEQMDTFFSLQQHRESSSYTSLQPKEYVTALCQDLQEAGFLQSSQNYLASLGAAGTSTPHVPAALGGIVIRTCDRPQYLHRLLNSLALRKMATQETVFVLDDSRSSESQQLNEQIVATLNARLEGGVFYLGEKWQAWFTHRLSVKFQAEKELINWLLAPRSGPHFTAGRLINLAMLLFAGRRLLLYDDDYVLDRALQPEEERSSELHITAQPDWMMKGYRDQVAVCRAGQETGLDPVFEHVSQLGKRLSDCVLPLGNYDLQQASLDRLSREHADGVRADSPILTTGNGAFGRPIDPSGVYLYLRSSRRVESWRDPESYAELRQGENIWKSVCQPTLSPFTLSTPAGIDNSVIMPPTTPTGKGEDTLFGRMVHKIYPSALHLEFPWAVGHFREARNWLSATYSSVAPLNLTGLIANRVIDIEGLSHTASPVSTYQHLGAALVDWATKPTEQLAADVLSCWAEYSTSKLWRLRDNHRDVNSEEALYRSDIEKIFNVNIDLLDHLTSLPPLQDSNAPADPEAQLDFLAKNISMYGRALKLWPTLWEYSREHQSEFLDSIKATQNPSTSTYSTLPLATTPLSNVAVTAEHTQHQTDRYLPDFIIIGAQKSGTTALAKSLADHSHIFVSGVHPRLNIDMASSEIHFFSDEKNWARGTQWYKAHFYAPEKIQGEKTPNYFPDAIARRRMATVIPNAKLILLLREPVARAYSQWNHYNQIIERSQTWGWRQMSFEEAVSRAMAGEAPFSELLDQGKYIDHLRDLLTLYPMEQIFIGTMELFKDDQNGQLARVVEFLGADPLELKPHTVHKRSYDSPISDSVKIALQEYFEPYNASLFELLGRELTEWEGVRNSEVSVALSTPGPHWIPMLQRDPQLGAQLLSLGKSLLLKGHTLSAQQAFENCATHAGSIDATLALADFWTALACPELCRLYLLSLAENNPQPGLCLRLARSYADEQNMEGAIMWWMRAYELLSREQLIPGKPLLNWLCAFRPAYGTSVFSALGIPKRDARRLLRIARLYSQGEMPLFQHTLQCFLNEISDERPARYDFRKLLEDNSGLVSILGNSASVTDYLLAIIRSQAGSIKVGATVGRSVQLHFSMNLKIGGTEWHMMRYLTSQAPEVRHVVITCERDEQADNPVLQAMAANSGVEVCSVRKFIDTEVQWGRLIGLSGDDVSTRELLSKHLDLDLIAGCVTALEYYSPEHVTVWGSYIFQHAAFAAYLCELAGVTLQVGSLPLQTHTGATIQARSKQLFIAKSCAMFMADRRFNMVVNTQAIWSDFQKKVPMAAAAERVRVRYNPFPRDLVESKPGITPAEIKVQLGLPKSDLVLGHVTRIDANKNFRLWLETAALVATAIQNVSFVIVGDGQAKNFAVELSRQLGIANRCRFVGRKVNNLKSYYQLMDAVLLTSDCEGLPNTLIEAQALGVPVVARATGGVAEAVWHEVTGLVIHSCRPADLAKAVERILLDIPFRQQARLSGPAFIKALKDVQPALKN